MRKRNFRPLLILLGLYWFWHASVVLAATGALHPLGYVGNTFYLENLLSLYVPPLLMGLIIWMQRKPHA